MLVGHTINGKPVKPFYKTKGIQYNPPEALRIFENTYETIIDTDMWELKLVQPGSAAPTILGRATSWCFARIVAGGTQTSRTKSISKNQESYVYGNYRSTVRTCTAHFIRTVVLEKLVLEDITAAQLLN